MKRAGASEEGDESASALINKRIADLDDWRGETLGRIRALIKEAESDVVEEWKWRGTPVWSHNGILCTGETYKNAVKMTFAKGAGLKDPSKLFNSSLEGNTRRAIDVHEGEHIDAAAFKALIRAAVALNAASKKAGTKATKSAPKVASEPTKAAPKAASKAVKVASKAAPKAASKRAKR